MPMYVHTNNASAYGCSCSSGFISQHHSNSNFSAPIMASPDQKGELHSTAHEAFKPGNGSSSTGCAQCNCTCTRTSYIGSPASSICCYTTSSSYPDSHSASLIQRSFSSHSFLFHDNGLYPPVSSPTTAFSDIDIGPFRRVFSTGELAKGVNVPCSNQNHNQGQGGSPPANESLNIILEGMSKAIRYSPEERRERIERYRSKRTQRNFNKKIQYTCRKTLADSRPRIRGRFARNDEIEKTNYATAIQWNQMAREDDDHDEDEWIHLLESISSNLVP